MSKINRQTRSSLTVAIPAYNEEDSLPWVLQHTIKTIPKYIRNYEILVINDGSKDKTSEIAWDFAKKHKFIRVIDQPNGGYGVAMLRGISEAKKDYVAYMPADGQFLIEDMRYCIEHMGDADLILGDRGVRLDYSLYRHILSRGYLFVLWMLFGIRYKDVNWLTIWRTKDVKKLKIRSRGIFLLAEIVIRFKQKGLRIVEAPSFYRSRRGGKVKNTKPSIVMQTLIDAITMWKHGNH